MAMQERKLSIERRNYDQFMRDFNAGKFGAQRLGQAFYNRQNLHKVVDQKQFQGLYELDGACATSLIKELFKFN